ncbi:MAG: NAD(+)/NADH kinase, partial [Armatimonadota bacterium]
MIQSVGIVAAPDRPHASESAGDLADRLAKLGVEAVLEHSPLPEDRREAVLNNDLVVVMGGDGSLLAVARQAAPLGVPVLGVDMGGVGFLAETKYELLCERLEKVVAGEFSVEARPLLEVVIGREDGEQPPLIAMNEASIARSLTSTLVHLGVTVAGEYVADYAADGLIVATSTGSTGYSLSAGGPIVDPRLEAMVIVPICPHTLHARPVVVAADVEVTVELRARDPQRTDVHLSVDGQITRQLQIGDRVSITEAADKARLVRLDGETFYHKLRS